MSTGSLANGKCFEALGEAQDAYFSSLAPFSYTSGSSTVVIQYIYVTGVWKKQWVTTSNTGVVTTNTVVATVPVLPVCYAPSEYFFDGLEVGAGLIALAAIAWSLHMLRRPIR